MGFDIEPSKNYTLCPSGTHIARCYMVIDMGHHEETYLGKSIGLRPKVRIGWEFPTKKHVFDEKKGEEPFVLSVTYTKSLNEKAKFLHVLESWSGKKFTPEVQAKFRLEKLIGQPCLINVIHEPNKKDNTMRARVAAIMQLGADMKATMPPAILTPILYTVDWGRDHETFKALPKFIQDKLLQCNEWRPAPEEEGSDEPHGTAPAPAESEGEDPF